MAESIISGPKVLGSAASFSAGVIDPLAQSFFVETPLYITKVDLFFSAKETRNIPVKIQIRKMVNGTPSQEVIPFSEKVVYPNQISISTNGTTATTISFDSPVFLDIGEYALTLISDSLNYRVWISQIGQRDIVTGALISEQPYIGVLFKSQNASTWTPDQYQDLKFTLYRASFVTSVTGTVEMTVPDTEMPRVKLDPDPFELYPNSNKMRIYHKNHGQNEGTRISIVGWPLNNLSFANADFYGITVDKLYRVPFTISDVTNDSYVITLPNTVNSNVTSTIRTGGIHVLVSQDFRYDTYYPAISAIQHSGTQTTHKIKMASVGSYAMDSSFTTINLNDYVLSNSRVLASNTNKMMAMSNSNPFIHRIEMVSNNEYLSPVIDIKKVSGVFARNVINNPDYDSQNRVNANDIVLIANNNNISVTQLVGPNGYGLITLTSASDKANASPIIKGSYLNISSNNNINTGRYRVLNVTDSGANVFIQNLTSVNVSTNSTATYTITYGRNFIAEEAPYDGSVYSKYITRQIDFANPCTSFKFFVDTVKPLGTNIDFYYKISEIGDTVDLRNKEYTKVSGVTIPDSLSGEYYEVNQIVENLPQFDAIIFKIVFTGTDSSQVPKCRKFRLIALA